MRPCRIAPASALGLVAWSLVLIVPAVGPAQESRKERTSAKADAGSGQEFDSREKLDAWYEKQLAELQGRRIADLTSLAAKQSGQEADDTYRHLFYRAMAQDQYEAAEEAARTYLDKGDDPKLRGLATLVRVLAEADRGAYDRSLQHLQSFLSKPEPGTSRVGKLDPQTILAVGESYLQHLMDAHRYDAAVKVARLLAEGDVDKSVKEHFQGRLDRLQMLGKPAPAIDAKDVDGEVEAGRLQGQGRPGRFLGDLVPPLPRDDARHEGHPVQISRQGLRDHRYQRR